MREIKFRVWDKRLKKMWEGGSVWFGVGSCVDANSTSDDVEIMQFTGLYDRNGKEIWEGDIVIIDGGLKWVCGWSDNHARFYFDTGLHKTDDFDSHEPYNFEVIGNIYENPDLLK